MTRARVIPHGFLFFFFVFLFKVHAHLLGHSLSRGVCIAHVVCTVSHTHVFTLTSLPPTLQKYLGEGPRMVRDVFRLAKENAPAIIFIDEVDAIATARFDAQTGADREVWHPPCVDICVCSHRRWRGPCHTVWMHRPAPTVRRSYSVHIRAC